MYQSRSTDHSLYESPGLLPARLERTARCRSGNQMIHRPSLHRELDTSSCTDAIVAVSMKLIEMISPPSLFLAVKALIGIETNESFK